MNYLLYLDCILGSLLASLDESIIQQVEVKNYMYTNIPVIDSTVDWTAHVDAFGGG